MDFLTLCFPCELFLLLLSFLFPKNIICKSYDILMGYFWRQCNIWLYLVRIIVCICTFLISSWALSFLILCNSAKSSAVSSSSSLNNGRSYNTIIQVKQNSSCKYLLTQINFSLPSSPSFNESSIPFIYT